MGSEKQKFDIDLAYGNGFENKVCELLRNGTVEVKTERDKWKTTANIVIELRYYGRKSGLLDTEADWWCHVLADGDEIVEIFLFPVPRLRIMVEKLLNRNEAVKVMGGDDNASELVLVPINAMYRMGVYSVGKVVN
jgi:hypothetical protein